MNKRAVGKQYEELAAAYLRGQGLTVVAQNWRCRSGEIDLICRDGRYLVFVEVKYRATARLGAPAEAVGYGKQQRIRRAAEYYLCRYGKDIPCRFDVVSILGSEVEWIRDAF